MEESTAKTSIYEIGFILVPTIGEGELASEFGAVKSKIEGFGAVAIAEEFPQRIDLAYEMAKTIANRKIKFNEGYFGWIKFELAPDKISLVKDFAEKNDKVIRALIISTVRENTVIGKKFVSKTERKRPIKGAAVSAEKTEVAGPIDAVELDKQIDSLVTE
jgi:ribosomal protein S6